jgi:hypothetical protein
MGFQEAREQKPYAFIPLPDHVEREKPAGHAGFKKGLLSGVITGELVALTPMHVASGNIELTGSERIPLVKAHFRSGGNIAIPGSSLKGAVRSVVEAITYSCVRVQSSAARSRLPADLKPCEIRDIRSKDSKLCPACRIFGAMGYHGQVRFIDAVLIEGRIGTILSPSLFSPRAYARIYYNRDGQVKGRKFYLHGKPAKGNVPLEACDVKSRFCLHAEFVNLTEAELGVLVTALGQGSSKFPLKLGGAKPACCGSVELSIASVNTQDAIRDALELDSTLCPVDLDSLLAAATKTLLVRPNIERLCNILKLQSGRSCPSESY